MLFEAKERKVGGILVSGCKGSVRRVCGSGVRRGEICGWNWGDGGVGLGRTENDIVT